MPPVEAFRIARDISDAHFRGETVGKTTSISSLPRSYEQVNDLDENISDGTQDFDYDAIDALNGWVEPDEKPQPEKPANWNPRNILKGTKVQNIVFHGGFRISRRMASYWRNDCAAEYQRCCEFVRGLLKKPLPRAPSPIEMATTAPLFNALLNETIKRKRKPAKLPSP